MIRESILKELDTVKADEQKDKEYISKLNRTKDKIMYLRFVKGYTQKATANLIGISERHVQRIEKELKMSC
ncbi:MULTISPECIES: sigma factor-like helix-turn-helix DNA-binding protein [Clostridium]|uniref:Sporulation sigma factor SigF n=1 Tax=Clostridium carnis TaxID=1530 RepID=A0ABY6ST80_9CLOT|nr:sigma factor-like helix-turn-helix DNA-binding protein [Clostridium carnis]CAI3661383.1 Sporulation sigma factor SigF [Clostridium neonatale]CAI3661992.1 Sporulation sigma factor SigF [Clostridium neonatale]CAI3682190.1 Sporulation sigma factor SigF [Clostridium neonatale]CAI3693715.1 Sporulation sigma factor SigF [Clostridium neonatale]CAI3706209.1 Sporulation sigma factor SigF [Clostridium neonatale]